MQEAQHWAHAVSHVSHTWSLVLSARHWAHAGKSGTLQPMELAATAFTLQIFPELLLGR